MKQLDMFEIININNKRPDSMMPNGVKLKQNQKWCPYCSKPVVFIKDKNRGVRLCPYCKISDKDYNVKMVNQKW